MGRPFDKLVDDVAAHVREMHEKARTLFLVSSQYLNEAGERPERKAIADAYFEAAVVLKREADALGQVIERHAGRVAQFPSPV